MFTQTHLRVLDLPSYQEMAAEYKKRGFKGESHDMGCLNMADTWRLRDGAEPNPVFGIGPLPHFLRYAPYRQAP